MHQRHLLVVVNTDKGLCGGLNSNIVKEAKAQARAPIAAGKSVEFFLVGRKGTRLRSGRDFADPDRRPTPAPCAIPGFARL
ncbi:MAG: F0F1 ATP synthase subunit gamma [Caenibius sp.]